MTILGRAWARECPNEADGGQPVVLHPPAGDRRSATGGTGDRRRAGERFETSGVSESLRVVANLGEQARTGDVAEAGKAR